MADVNISKFRAQVVREGSKPATPGFVVSEGQNPVDPAGSGQNHLPVTIGTPANGLAVTEAQVLTIDKAQIFAGTSSQFVKGDGTLDSTAYGTGSVTSVGLTMPSAFSVANSPVTTAGTLAVTGAGTTAQYIRGDGTLATFPALTGFVPYTGATADVNLGTHDLAAERGTFENNGSSNTLTVNHTSGSGYGIIVTKGGNNEALYVSKTSGSGNAMTVVGGRTSLVDLALSSVTNTAGDFLTISGGVVHKRTAAEVRTDIGAGTVTSVGLSSATSGVTIGSTPITTSGTITIAIATASGSQNGLLSSTDWTTFNNKQNALTNPVTGTGTTNYLPKFTGSTTIGNSALQELSGNLGLGVTPSAWDFPSVIQLNTSGAFLFGGGNTILGFNAFFQSGWKYVSSNFANYYEQNAGQHRWFNAPSGTAGNAITFSQPMTLTSGGNLLVGTTTDVGFKLDVNGTGRFSGNIGVGTAPTSTDTLSIANTNARNELQFIGSEFTNIYSQTTSGIQFGITSSGNSAGIDFLTNNSIKLTITSGGNVGIGTSSPAHKLTVEGATSNLLNLYSSSNFGEFSINVPSTNLVTFNLGTGDDLAINTGGAERLRIKDGGNVGIGTSSPGDKLHVANNGTGAYSAALWTNSNSTANLYVGVGGSAVLNTPLQNNAYVMNAAASGLAFGTSDAVRMFITSGGNVLIGTTTDVGAKLYVNGGIRTANPTGSTSNDWLLGRALTSGTSSPDRWIRVQIGNLYYDILAVYMGSV